MPATVDRFHGSNGSRTDRPPAGSRHTQVQLGVRVGEIHHEMAGEVAGLKANITSVLKESEVLPSDDPRYEALFARLEAAGTAPLENGAGVPAMLEAPQRMVSEKVVTW